MVDRLREATRQVVHPCQCSGEPVRAGHVGHDPGGVSIGDPASRSDIERSSRPAADYFDCMCGRAEGRLCDTDDWDTNGVSDVRSEPWAPLDVESGVTVDD